MFAPKEKLVYTPYVFTHPPFDQRYIMHVQYFNTYLDGNFLKFIRQTTERGIILVQWRAPSTSYVIVKLPS